MPLISDLLPLIFFVILMVASPGPANLVLIGMGSKQKYTQNLEFVLGLIAGKAILGVLIGLGFADIFSQNQTVSFIFSLVSTGYLIYLALLSFRPNKNNQNKKIKKLGFLNGLILHPLNPKAWVMLVLAYSEFGALFENQAQAIALIGLIFAIHQFIFASFYLTIGSLAKTYLENNPYLNRIFAILSVVLVVYFLFDGI